MSGGPTESVVLCEGFHDRAFWAGILLRSKCTDARVKPKIPAKDPWGRRVGPGQYAYINRQDVFVRVQPCHGDREVIKALEQRLIERETHPLHSVVVCLDSDALADAVDPMATAERRVNEAIKRAVKGFDSPVSAEYVLGDEGDGTLVVPAIWWSSLASGALGVPEKQTLERVVCAAIRTAYGDRAEAVHQWLAGLEITKKAEPKHHSWSYMAGWYASQGCDQFYSCLWEDPKVADELEKQLRETKAWHAVDAVVAASENE